MGNNLQALRTAKALTKQLSGSDSFVTANNSRNLEIESQNGDSSLSLSMSLIESPDSVTQGQTSTRESDSRQNTKELMTNKSNALAQPEFLNGITNTNHKQYANSFVYYVPQNNTPHTQSQDGNFEERINSLQYREETNKIQQEKTNSKPSSQSKSDPVVVDLTLDDSDEEQDPSSQTDDSTSTFPKILAAYSLNAAVNSTFPASELCTYLSQKARENQLKPNGTVVDALTLNRTKNHGLVVDSSSLSRPKVTNGLVFHNRPKMHHFDIPDQRTSSTNSVSDHSNDNIHGFNKNSGNQVQSSCASSMAGLQNGVMTDVTNSTNQVHSGIVNYKNDVTKNVNSSTHHRYLSSVANDENDVMNDVTKLRQASAYEYRPLLFSSWNKIAESRSSDTETSSSDSGDNVVITKVVTPSDRTEGRPTKKHPRKEPIKVRQLYFDQEVNTNETTNPVVQDASKKRTLSSTSLQQSARKKSRVDDMLTSVQSGSRWPVDVPSQQTSSDRLSPNNIHREAKIRTLKNLLAKQELAVQKLRTQDNGSPSLVPSDRVLVVEIPDLKSELRLPKEGKPSFRVSSQTITLSPNDHDSARKRPRKRDPRRITRPEDRYPSYVEARGLSRLHDDDDAANKKFKGKTRGKSRGRCSPKLNRPVPVVHKDLWHQELEKVEAVLARTDRPIDKATFMLFLGLKQV